MTLTMRRRRATTLADRLPPRVRDASSATAVWVGPRTEAVRGWATPHVESARVWAGPRVENVRGRAQQEVLPAVTAAVAGARTATGPVLGEARLRGDAALHALQGDLRYKPRRRRGRRGGGGGVRRFLGRFALLGSVLGGGYAAYQAWSSSRPDPWEDIARSSGDTGGSASSSGTTTGTTTTGTTTGGPVGGPVPSAPPTTTHPPTADVAGAGPDEAVADETAESAVVREDVNEARSTNEPRRD